MRGIQFIYNNEGKKISAVVDLRRYEKEFAVFLDQLAKKRRRPAPNPTPNSNPVIGDTIDVIGGGSALNARKIGIRKSKLQNCLPMFFSFDCESHAREAKGFAYGDQDCNSDVELRETRVFAGVFVATTSDAS